MKNLILTLCLFVSLGSYFSVMGQSCLPAYCDLIPNGGFEVAQIDANNEHTFVNGKVCSWFEYELSPQVIQPGGSGNKYCLLWSAWDASEKVIVNLGGNLMPGLPYVLSFRYKIGAQDQGTTGIDFLIGKGFATLSPPIFEVFSVSTNPTTQWQTATVCIVVSSLVGFNQILVSPHYTGGNYDSKAKDILIDDVSLKIHTLENMPNITTCQYSNIGPQCVIPGASYSWTPASAFVNSNVSNPIVSTNVSQTVTLNMTDACGSLSDQVGLTITSSPLTVASSVNTCFNQPVVLTASGASSYTWSKNGVTIGTGAQITVNPTTTTTYHVVGTTNGCPTLPTPVTVNVEKPWVEISSNSGTCIDLLSDIEIWATSNATSYSWTGPNGYMGTAQNILIADPTPANSGIYTVVVTNSNGCTNITAVDYEIICCPLNTGGNVVVHKNATWTGTNNPFGNVNPVIFDGTITIEAGGSLTIKDMEIQFSPNSKIIIKPGATTGNELQPKNGGVLTADHCTLTVSVCEPKMWHGVEVWGNSTMSQYLQGGALWQGRFIMKNGAVLKHSVNGAVAARLDATGKAVSGYNGGIITANDSYFLNNRQDVRLEKYSNYLPANNAHMINRSQFSLTLFETQQGLIDGSLPTQHVYLYAVDGVTFLGCRFAHSAGYTINNRGIGINSLESSFRVLEKCTSITPYLNTCTNYTPSSFAELKYGIYATNASPFNAAQVNRVNFNLNYRGIYLGDLDASRITKNNFNIDKSPTPGNEELKSYGLYLEGCRDYVVEENSFDGLNGSDYRAGIVVRNSGDGYNEIYKNTFEGLSQGILALEDNDKTGQNNEGLQLLCNDFTNDDFDIYVYDGDISDVQGTCTGTAKGPAGNRFDHSCSPSTDQAEILLVKISQDYSYNRHTDYITTPQCYTKDPGPNGFGIDDVTLYNICTAYNQTASCPSNLTKKITNNDPIIIIQEAIDPLTQKLTDGNSSLLLDMIYGDLPAGVVTGALMDASPYLSDEVLIAAINRKPTPLPAGNIQQIVTANSPLSDEVLEASMQRIPALPNGIKNQIISVQTGTSEREELLSEIGYLKGEKAYLVSHLIQYYLMGDTIVKLDSIEILLKAEHELGDRPAKCEMAGLYEKQGKYTEMEAEIIAQHPDGELDKYCRMLQIFSDYKRAGHDHRELINHENDKIFIERTAQENEGKIRFAAQSIEKLVFEKHYEERIEIPSAYSARMANSVEDSDTRIGATEDIAFDNEIKIYPNPSRNKVNIELIGGRNIKQFSLYNHVGQLVLSKQSNSPLETIDIGHLSSGLYLVEITTDDKEVKREKLIIEN